MPDVRWFPGATLNYAANALRAARTDPGPYRDDLPRRGRAGRGALTYGELAGEVARVPRGLAGARRAHRATGSAAYLPNIPEALIALLATASLGAIWSSCSPDFGAPASSTGSRRSSPKVLIAVDGYRYGGKAFDRRRGGRRDRRRAARASAAVVLTGGSDVLAPRRWSCPASAAAGLGRPGRPDPAGADRTFEAGAVRPSAVGAVLLGHHRPAQADRARSRRHRARAPQGAVPSTRTSGPATCSSGTPRPAG